MSLASIKVRQRTKSKMVEVLCIIKTETNMKANGQMDYFTGRGNIPVLIAVSVLANGIKARGVVMDWTSFI